MSAEPVMGSVNIYGEEYSVPRVLADELMRLRAVERQAHGVELADPSGVEEISAALAREIASLLARYASRPSLTMAEGFKERWPAHDWVDLVLKAR